MKTKLQFFKLKIKDLWDKEISITGIGFDNIVLVKIINRFKERPSDKKIFINAKPYYITHNLDNNGSKEEYFDSYIQAKKKAIEIVEKFKDSQSNENKKKEVKDE